MGGMHSTSKSSLGSSHLSEGPATTMTAPECPAIMTAEPPALGRPLSYTFEVDAQSVQLHRIPREVLLHLLSFVSGGDLVHRASLVCKYWLDLVETSDLWRLKCKREQVSFPSPVAVVGMDVDYRMIYFKHPFGRNLIKNWNASGK